DQGRRAVTGRAHGEVQPAASNRGGAGWYGEVRGPPALRPGGPVGGPNRMTVAAARRVRSRSAARDRMRLTPRAAILLIVIAGLLFALVVPLRTYVAQRAQLAKLQRQEQVLQQQNAALQVQVQQLHDPAYLEQLAR